MNSVAVKYSSWREGLSDLTPVETVAGLQFKREDKFAPLGYGCINGSKLRQLIWLVDGYVKKGDARGLISGASVHSPQLSMGSAVAAHYGIPSTHVLGATNPTSSLKYLDVEMASRFGATFEYSKVAYNGALQGMVKRLLKTERYSRYFYLEYGVTLGHREHRARDIEAFHRVGAEQVRNLPDCNYLILPAGSCNSLVSILYGLAIFRPNIKRLVLVEIGPNRRQWVRERLLAIQAIVGGNVAGVLNAYNTEYHDLHGSKYVTYQETMRYLHGDIAMHPRYEGKVMTYLSQHRPRYLTDPDNVMWIIAGEGKKSAFEKVFCSSDWRD